MVYANDNVAPISGKAAAAWPAMTTAIRNGDELAERTLWRLSRLFELSYGDPSSIPSPAGSYGEGGKLAIDETPEDSEPAKPVGDVDTRLRDGTGIDWLVRAGSFGAHTAIAAPGKAGGERTPNFRIRHVPIKGGNLAEFILQCCGSPGCGKMVARS